MSNEIRPEGSSLEEKLSQARNQCEDMGRSLDNITQALKDYQVIRERITTHEAKRPPAD